MLYWQKKRLYSFYCWLQEQCWSITLAQDYSPHIQAIMNKLHSANHLIYLPNVPCIKTRQLKTTGWRRQESDNMWTCVSNGISIEGMRRRQTGRQTEKQHGALMKSQESQERVTQKQCDLLLFFLVLMWKSGHRERANISDKQRYQSIKLYW